MTTTALTAAAVTLYLIAVVLAAWPYTRRGRR